MGGRGPAKHVFLNRRGRPSTRFGIHALVERAVARASTRVGTLASKRVSPHTIRAWLGHVSLSTTNVYAEVDLEMKAKALANCEIDGEQSGAPRKENAELMEFLRTL